MLYAVLGSVLVAVLWCLIAIPVRYFSTGYVPSFLFTSDAKPRGEPLLVVCAFIFDYFVGRNGLTLCMGWWFFLYVLQSVPWHMYSNILCELYGEKYCKEYYPNISEWRSSHKTFIFFIYYALFLSFWWKWI